MEQRLRQDAHRADWDEAYVDHDLVFAPALHHPHDGRHLLALLTGVGTSAAEAADSLIMRGPVTSGDDADELTRVQDEIEGLGRQITAPGADVTALAAQITALQERRAARLGQPGRDQSVTTQPLKTPETPPPEPEKGPLPSRFTSGAEGTRTPDPLHAMEVRYQLRHSPATPTRPGQPGNPSQWLSRMRNRPPRSRGADGVRHPPGPAPSSSGSCPARSTCARPSPPTRAGRPAPP
jgi:hypothetical protein